MKTIIKILIILFIIVISCDYNPSNNNLNNENLKQIPNRKPIIVFDSYSNPYDCDSTIDVMDEQGNWFKLLYKDNKIYLTFPYEWNPKGFKTVSKRSD